MGIYSGQLSSRRYVVADGLNPDDVVAKLSEAPIKSWVLGDPVHLADIRRFTSSLSAFRPVSYECGGGLVLATYVVERVKVSPKLKKAVIDHKVAELKKSQPMVGKADKAAIRDQVDNQLRHRAPPQMVLADICYDPGARTLRVFGAPQWLEQLLITDLEKLLGTTLRPYGLFTALWRNGWTEEQIDKLHPNEANYDVYRPYRPDNVGSEFLVWLWAKGRKLGRVGEMVTTGERATLYLQGSTVSVSGSLLEGDEGVRSLLCNGYWPSKLETFWAAQDFGFRANISAHDLSLSAIQLPNVAEGTKEEKGELRMALLAQLEEFVDAVYLAFAEAMIDPVRSKELRAELHKWSRLGEDL